MPTNLSPTSPIDASDAHEIVKHLALRGSGQLLTCSGAVTLDDTVPNISRLDPGGAARTITLPTAATASGRWYLVENAADGEEPLTFSYASSTVGEVLARGDRGLFVCDGSSWKQLLYQVQQRAPINVETLAGDKVLVSSDAACQKLDPDGSARNVDLPAVAGCANRTFRIVNNANGAENVVVRAPGGGSTIVTLAQNKATNVYVTGGAWVYDAIESITL